MKKIYAFLFLLFHLNLHAGGICLYEISTTDLSLASAGWSARAEDASTLFTNPAGMIRLCKPQLEVGAQPIFLNLKFDPNDETTVEGSPGSANKWLPSGSFFYVYPADDFAFGIGSLGYFGSVLDYNPNWVGRYYLRKAQLQGFSLIPAAAYRINECWSIGAGLNAMYGVFKQTSSVNNILDALPDGRLRFKDERFGFGAVVGVLFEPDECTRFGIQYLSPVRLKFRAHASFNEIGPALAAILLATGLDNSTLHLGVKVPQSIMASFYRDLNYAWSIMGNLGWQQWSKFQKVSISLADPANRVISIPEHYQDTWHAALGIQWHYNECLTISSGAAYDSSAVSNKNRSLDFPVGRQWRFGTGFSYFPCENLVVALSSELQWQGKLPVDVNGGPLAGHVSGNFTNSFGIFTSLNASWNF